MPLPSPLAFPLGGDGPTPAVLPHIDAAVDRLAQQYRELPNITGLLTATCEQMQDADDTARTLSTMLDPDASVGAQLDKLGGVIGEARQGFDDGSYAQHIKARIFLNRSSGTIPELLTMFNFILGDGYPLVLTEYFPASFLLNVDGALDPTTAAYLLSFLRAGKPAGVRAFLEWSSVSPTETFTFLDGGGAGFDDGIFASVSD